MMNKRKLFVTAYADGWTQWYTRCDDPWDAVKADGYWDAAWDMLRQGDIIVIHTPRVHGEGYRTTQVVVEEVGEDRVRVDACW